LYRINGVEDHIHIVIHLHPTVALANFVKDIKTASSVWIKQENIFSEFESWQIGYAAFTYSREAKGNLIEYVKNQEIHHEKQSFIE
jgi:putative transposase